MVYVLFAIDDDPEVARSMVASSVEEFAPGDRDERLAKLGIDEAVVAGERVDRYAVAGTPADCARAVDALVASGATSVVVVPRADDPSAQDAQIARFVREVVPLVGAR